MFDQLVVEEMVNAVVMQSDEFPTVDMNMSEKGLCFCVHHAENILSLGLQCHIPLIPTPAEPASVLQSSSTS